MIDSWRHVARVSRAVFWLGVALFWTSCQTVELVRELRPAPTPAPLADEPPAPERLDCLTMMPDGRLCRREVLHAGPCSPKGGTDEP